MEKEDYKKFKEDVHQAWLDENCKISGLCAPSIIPMKPDLGYYLKVDMVDIPADIFPDEFKQIADAYSKVLNKLSDHYKLLNKK